MLIASLFLAFAYYGYRYPLQYNVSGYGNVYRDTPPVLSAGKYVLHLGLLATMIAMVAAIGRPLVLSRSAIWLFVTAATTASMATINGGYAPSLAVPFIFSLLCAALVSVVVRSVPVAADHLWRAGGWMSQVFVLLSALANVGQMVLYAAIGRLPAHGYPGLIVRFGGFWDDPNQSGMFSAVVVVVLASFARRRDRRPSRLVVAAGCFNVLVAISYSGYVALAIGLIVVYAHGRPGVRRRRRRLPWPLLLGGIAVAALTLLPLNLAPVSRAASGKSDSAKLRLSVIYRLEGNTFAITDVPNPIGSPGAILDTMVRGDGRVSSETSIVRIVLIAGIVPLLTMGAWLAIVASPALRAMRPWGTAVVIAFLAGALFVPFLVAYPTGLFFFAGMEVAAVRARSLDTYTNAQNAELAVPER